MTQTESIQLKSAEKPLLEVKGLKKVFGVSRQQGFRTIRESVRAVDGIDLTIYPGETVGLVGESGCGKTTAGRSILRLIEPTSGSVMLDGIDLLSLKGEALRQTRKEVGIVFQDPYAALNPRMLIGDIVAEPLLVHKLVQSKEAAWKKSRELLETVGLNAEFASRYPHEFSGGQRQRIGIARAIATDPKLIILDEPISALDLSIRAQILNLLEELQSTRGLSYLFIAHDLSVVRHICDRVAVMYLGVIVEEGDSDEVFTNPLHPYTKALLDAIPIADPSAHRKFTLLEGDAPSPISIPSGCRFHTRCPIAEPECALNSPELRDIKKGHRVSCRLV